MPAISLKAPGGIDHLQLIDIEPRPPGEGEVQVEIKASSLNYRDYVVVTGLLPTEDGRIPMSDGAGVVTAVGDGVTEFAIGDRVLSHFFRDWQDGAPSFDRIQRIPGDNVDGFAASTVTVPAYAFSRMPANLDFAAASTLPCAGLTAWRAVMVETHLLPGDWVLVQGSGGVSLFALQFARMLGCRVIATSSSDEKLERMQALGAEQLINYREQPNWGDEVLARTGGEGASLVVEVGGQGTVSQSVRAVAFNGCISMIGGLTGFSAAEVPTTELYLKNACLQGITVGSQKHHLDMVRAVEANNLQPVIDSSFPLAELADAFRHQESQRQFGKICVDI